MDGCRSRYGEFIETTIANTDYAIRIIDLKTEDTVYEVKVVITKATAYTVTFCQEDYLSTLSQVKYSYGEKKVFPDYQIEGHNVSWITDNDYNFDEDYTFDQMGNMLIYAVVILKTYRVRLVYNDKKIFAKVPGIGEHFLQPHALVFIRGHGPKDSPGINYHLVRGLCDFSRVEAFGRKNRRSKFGVKNPSKNS